MFELLASVFLESGCKDHSSLKPGNGKKTFLNEKIRQLKQLAWLISRFFRVANTYFKQKTPSKQTISPHPPTRSSSHPPSQLLKFNHAHSIFYILHAIFYIFYSTYNQLSFALLSSLFPPKHTLNFCRPPPYCNHCAPLFVIS